MSSPNPAALLAKTIGDLDGLISATAKSLPGHKAWQRQVKEQLQDADRCMQVLRMVIALDRNMDEARDAADGMRHALRRAMAFIASARSDVTVRAAVNLAVQLADRVHRGVSDIVRSARP